MRCILGALADNTLLNEYVFYLKIFLWNTTYFTSYLKDYQKTDWKSLISVKVGFFIFILWYIVAYLYLLKS